MKPQTETSELLLNKGDGTFALGPAKSPLSPKAPNYDAPAGASFIDFDRDGNIDLWVVENTVNGDPKQDRLYRGDGHGGFTDVTFDMGLRTKAWGSDFTPLNLAQGNSIGWAANACDLNGDGSAELLASSYGRAPNELWQSKGKDGGFQFLNQSIASGYAFDGNQDWHDNESARCWCTLHPTDTGCAGVPAPMYILCMTDADAFRWNNATDQEPFRLGGNSGTTTCADIDNDGHLDLVSTGTSASRPTRPSCCSTPGRPTCSSRGRATTSPASRGSTAGAGTKVSSPARCSTSTTTVGPTCTSATPITRATTGCSSTRTSPLTSRPCR